MRVTLGPKGRNVVLDKSFGAPRITKDGVTAAKEIELEDKFENMGAQMVRDKVSNPELFQRLRRLDLLVDWTSGDGAPRRRGRSGRRLHGSEPEQ